MQNWKEEKCEFVGFSGMCCMVSKEKSKLGDSLIMEWKKLTNDDLLEYKRKKGAKEIQ